MCVYTRIFYSLSYANSSFSGAAVAVVALCASAATIRSKRRIGSRVFVCPCRRARACGVCCCGGGAASALRAVQKNCAVRYSKIARRSARCWRRRCRRNQDYRGELTRAVERRLPPALKQPQVDARIGFARRAAYKSAASLIAAAAAANSSGQTFGSIKVRAQLGDWPAPPG